MNTEQRIVQNSRTQRWEPNWNAFPADIAHVCYNYPDDRAWGSVFSPKAGAFNRLRANGGAQGDRIIYLSVEDTEKLKRGEARDGAHYHFTRPGHNQWQKDVRSTC